MDLKEIDKTFHSHIVPMNTKLNIYICGGWSCFSGIVLLFLSLLGNKILAMIGYSSALLITSSILTLALGIGILTLKSRVCSTILFVINTLDKLLLLAMSGFGTGIVSSLFGEVVLFLGMMATYSYQSQKAAYRASQLSEELMQDQLHLSSQLVKKPVAYDALTPIDLSTPSTSSTSAHKYNDLFEED